MHGMHAHLFIALPSLLDETLLVFAFGVSHWSTLWDFIQILLLLCTHLFLILVQIITPHTCARGKAINLSICCHRRWRHENHQISNSRQYACCKHNKLVDISDKVVSTRFELLKMVYKIMHFLFSMPVVYWPHPLYWCWCDCACSSSVKERVVKS